MAPPHEVPILERDYADRQLIFVTNDVIAQVARTEMVNWKGRPDDKAKASTGKKTWWWYASLLLKPEAEMFRVLARMLGTAAEAVRAWKRATDSGVNILPVGKTDAKQIRFPPGHPRDGVVYVGHPAVANVYYPMADFHRVTFEHKFCEAIHLLMSLGATKLRVEHVSGWSKDFSARISVPLAEPSESVTLEAGKNSGSTRTILYDASLAGTEEPIIPKGLVWYPHQATWQEVARGRLSFGLNNFSLGLTYEDDFGINADLKAAVANAGLKFGGKFENHQSTIWRLEGTFKT